MNVARDYRSVRASLKAHSRVARARDLAASDLNIAVLHVYAKPPRPDIAGVNFDSFDTTSANPVREQRTFQYALVGFLRDKIDSVLQVNQLAKSSRRNLDSIA